MLLLLLLAARTLTATPPRRPLRFVIKFVVPLKTSAALPPTGLARRFAAPMRRGRLLLLLPLRWLVVLSRLLLPQLLLRLLLMLRLPRLLLRLRVLLLRWLLLRLQLLPRLRLLRRLLLLLLWWCLLLLLLLQLCLLSLVPLRFGLPHLLQLWLLLLL